MANEITGANCITINMQRRFAAEYLKREGGKKMKAMFRLFMIVVLLTGFGLSLTFQAAAAEPITLKMSATQPLTHPNYLAQKYLADLLEKRAPGRFNITRYGAMTIGPDIEVARQVRAGLIQFATNTTTNLSNISAPFAVCDLPYMFHSDKEAQAVLASPFGKKLMDTLPGKGVVGLAFIPAAFRDVFNSKRPVNTMKDLKGLKLRTARSKIDIASAKAVGIAATPLGFADVYNGIKQGVVEGLLIPALLGYGMRFHEVAPYITKSYHQQCFTLVWFCNKKWFDSIPADLKKIFLDSVKEAAAWQIQNTYEQDLKVEKKLKAEGATITVLTPQAEKPMIAASEKVWDGFRAEIPAEYFKAIENAKAAYRKGK